MIDLFVIAGFLSITLLLGLLSGRGLKDIKEFAVGGRRYGSFALFATLSASFIGGGYTFGLSEKVYSQGLVYVFGLFGFSLQLILIAFFVAPKMERFSDVISVGDIMDKLYGPVGRFVTGISSVLVCSGIIGAQVGATGYVFHLFLGIDQTLGIFIGCGIVFAYSVLGGMKAVVATDILQFAILMISIPAAFILGVNACSGFSEILRSIPETHVSFPGTFSYVAVGSVFLSLLIGETMVPPYVQRLFIAKDIASTRRGVLWSGLISIPFFTIAGGIGLIALTLSPEINPNLAFPHVVNTVLPVGLKGMAIAGIIAVVMSSADSYLNAAAVAVVHDLVRPIKGEMSPKAALTLVRFSTLGIGLAAVIFAIASESVLDILLYSYNFWSPIILIPLVGGILGFKINPSHFLMCGAIGAGSVILWNMVQPIAIDGLVIGTVMNLLCFVICVAHVRAQENVGTISEATS